MLKEYLGPDDEVRVVVAGNEIGIVRRGESIVVPDELAKLTEWPSECWQSPKATASKGSDK